jgi:aminodeoxyfutalosine deaminase
METRLRARWLYPGDGPPVPEPVLTIDRGRIVAIEPGGPDADLDLGAVAVIPSLINTHTHLEFSRLTQPLEPLQDFPAWIRSVIDWRRREAASETDAVEAIRHGWRESRGAGVTQVGEIVTSDWPVDGSWGEQPLPRGVLFRELLGLSDRAVEEQHQIAANFLQRADTLTGGGGTRDKGRGTRDEGQGPRAKSQEPKAKGQGPKAKGDTAASSPSALSPQPSAPSTNWRPGLSPHAPYSVHPELFRNVCGLARSAGVPVAMHLAESPAELQLLRDGSGPLVTLLEELGVWKPGLIPRGTGPLWYLEELATLPHAIVVHGNLLDEEEISFLSQHPQLSVVYCPRTHAAMHGGRPAAHPWRCMLAAGINVAVGTDSRASNPDLSVWKELQFLHQQELGIPASELLKLATVHAARALGLAESGRIAVGERADLCLVRLPDNGDQNPERTLLHGTIASETTIQGTP